MKSKGSWQIRIEDAVLLCAQLRPHQAVWPEDLIERKEIGLDVGSWTSIGASADDGKISKMCSLDARSGRPSRPPPL